MSGIVNVIILVGVLAAGAYAWIHRDELMAMINGGGGGGGKSSPPPSSDSGGGDASAAPDPSSGSDSSSSPDTSLGDPTTVPSKKSSKVPSTGGTPDMTSSATDIATGKTAIKKQKCKKGYHYDSKKKKCVKTSTKKKSHMAMTSALYAQISI